MLTLEEFLDSVKPLLRKASEEEEAIESAIRKIGELARTITEPLSEECLVKLRDFLSYVAIIPSLPKDRQLKRLSHASGMLNRLKEICLLPSLDLTSCDKSLDASVKFAKGVGEYRAKILKNLGIETIRDLLTYFPRIHEDRRVMRPISSLKEGEKVTVKGRIESVDVRNASGFNIVTAVVSDGFSHILLKWFNQPYVKDKLVKGATIVASGVVKKGYYGQLEMNSPEFEIAEKGDTEGKIVPIYSLTTGITQKQMRRILEKNVHLSSCFVEELPDVLLSKRRLLDLPRAIYGMHFPSSFYHLNRSRERLAYEELFYLQLAVLYVRRLREKERGGIPKQIKGELAQKFIQMLPFKLTASQIKAHEEIRRDMMSEKPMNRLLQGDVGSGKTVVAELAILDNYEAGFQSAVMAPTSILAHQHFVRLSRDFLPLGLKVDILTHATLGKRRERLKLMLEEGELDVVVGTHALIQEDIKFANLGLAIVDEQHRFGVRQREALVSKGHLVDVLVMTATPIPRTLALTLYGDLDVSVMREMPRGRKQIKTLLVNEQRLHEVFKFVRKEVEAGNRAFIVYPLVEESEKLELKAAVQMYEAISQKIFPDLRVGLIHGRMSGSEKDEAMEKLASGEYQILVSTTVIEVGIDVPDATVMVIEHPERFGLAQLHQLRGRVGRSNKQAYCFLIVGSNLSDDVRERLMVFASTNDGFKLAEYDLQMRGPGEFVGVKQHGFLEFKVANLLADHELLEKAREDALELLESDPDLTRYRSLYEKVVEMYGEKLRFVEVG
ncbi:MAG TPA: DNA helicase RecG [Thermotogae bacterium]|nr:DNA helicase RecG [Thermotogota bacterium]